MNVAVTRPRMCLVVVGDGQTLLGRGVKGKSGKNILGVREEGEEIEEQEFVRKWVEWVEGKVSVDVRYPSLEEAVREAGEVGVA